MKKIINKKLYDTETAELLASDSFSGPRDFHYWIEDLYRKKNGEYFLYGEGGPLSKYAEPADPSGWTNGCDIIPLTDERAREWAEHHASIDEYVTIFGEPEE